MDKTVPFSDQIEKYKQEKKLINERPDWMSYDVYKTIRAFQNNGLKKVLKGNYIVKTIKR